MNDRFKFRAWDKESKRIFDVRELGFMRDTLEMGHICLDKPGNDYYGIEIESVEEYILMQCTGLKDKNGVLIYEGDICKIPDFSNTLFSIYFSEKDACFDAKCQNGGANLTFSDEFEVIGNIYENPELLEVNNANF